MIEPTDEMVQAAQRATCGAESDECMRDALAAVLAIVERERCLERRGHVFHPLRNWPPRRGGSHPHYCVSCSTGVAPGSGCSNCRSTGMDQTPWPDCEQCRFTRQRDARRVDP